MKQLVPGIMALVGVLVGALIHLVVLTRRPEWVRPLMLAFTALGLALAMVVLCVVALG